MKISKEWTDKERFHIALKIAKEMNQNYICSGNQVLDWSERLFFVLTSGSYFLENNRNSIINGQIKKNIQ